MMLASYVEYIVQHWWVFPVSFVGLFILGKIWVHINQSKTTQIS